MRKTRIAVLAGLVTVIGLLFAGSVYAWWNDGYVPCCAVGTNVEAVANFQQATLELRDELLSKQIELSNEYDKPGVDSNRIGELRKEIIELRSMIQTTAGIYGLPADCRMVNRTAGFGDRRMGRGMMMGYPCPMRGGQNY